MTNPLRRPIKLLPTFQERVWGRDSLSPFFGGAPLADRIGEVWFTFADNETSLDKTLGELLQEHPELLGTAGDSRHPGVCPILLKLLFTTAKLSVQVHPDDDYARTRHGCMGKTEAWYVLQAQPPGEIALGFRKQLTAMELRDAVQHGGIEKLLDWRRVSDGDVLFTPAGTVHAIGAGLTICEIQQNCDITYRLYDYGRRRELHLEDGLKVARLGPHEPKVSPVALASWRDQLVECKYFRIERLRPKTTLRIEGGLDHYLVLFCVRGWGRIAGESTTAGEAWFVPAGAEPFSLDAGGSEWILTYSAKEPLGGIGLV